MSAQDETLKAAVSSCPPAGTTSRTFLYEIAPSSSVSSAAIPSSMASPLSTRESTVEQASGRGDVGKGKAALPSPSAISSSSISANEAPATSPLAMPRSMTASNFTPSAAATVSGVAAPIAVAGIMPGTEPFALPRSRQARITRDPERWMVAMNESEGAVWAFNNAVNNMDKDNDTLILITISSKKLTEERYTRDILLRYARRAERMGVRLVRNVKLWLRMGRDVGHTLCLSVEDAKVNSLVLGHERPGQSYGGIFGAPSVTRHCISMAKCNVIVVQHEIRLVNSDALLEDEMRDELEKKRLDETGEELPPVIESFEKHLTIGGKTYAVEITF